MADPVWYYARGDVERGPFTLPQIRALANASKLRPDDLVWKEGMENWTAAREIAELFPAAGLVGEQATANGSVPDRTVGIPAASPGSTAISEETRNVLHRIGRALSLLGIVLTVATYGCETLGARRVIRLSALAELQSSTNAAAAGDHKQAADRAAQEHQASAFARGVALLLGLLILLAGAVGLAYFADRYERWLGLGTILVVVYSTLTALTKTG